VVESSGLLNRRRPLKSTGGSNPPLSASSQLVVVDLASHLHFSFGAPADTHLPDLSGLAIPAFVHKPSLLETREDGRAVAQVARPNTPAIYVT
jgi:hypothetical protein